MKHKLWIICGWLVISLVADAAQWGDAAAPLHVAGWIETGPLRAAGPAVEQSPAAGRAGGGVRDLGGGIAFERRRLGGERRDVLEKLDRGLSQGDQPLRDFDFGERDAEANGDLRRGLQPTEQGDERRQGRVHHLPEDAEVRDLRAERVRHFLDAVA